MIFYPYISGFFFHVLIETTKLNKLPENDEIHRQNDIYPKTRHCSHMPNTQTFVQAVTFNSAAAFEASRAAALLASSRISAKGEVSRVSCCVPAGGPNKGFSGQALTFTGTDSLCI